MVKANEIKMAESLYGIITTIYVVAAVILFALSWFVQDIYALELFPLSGVIWGTLIAVTVLSVKQVNTDEWGGITFFGKPVKMVESGFHLCVWPFLVLGVEARKALEEQFPQDPEKVFLGTDEEYNALSPEEQARFVRPTRYVTGPGKEGSPSGDALESRMTLIISSFVRYRIINYFQFVINIGSTKEIRRQIQDTIDAQISEEVSSRSAAQVVRDLQQISNNVLAAVKRLVEDWGIEVMNLRLLSPNLGKTVAQAQADLVAARHDADATIVSKSAEAVGIEKTGFAQARVKKALLQADAEGVSAIIDTAKDGQSRDVLATVLTARTLGETKTTILATPGEFASTLGMAAAAIAATQKEKPPTTQQTPKE